MSSLEQLLDRLEQLLLDVEELDDPVREQVFELLDGVDTLHRIALRTLATELGTDEVERLRESDPTIGWLFDAYDIRPPEPPAPTPVQLGPTRRR